MVSSELASGLSGEQSTVLGQERGWPEEGQAEGGEINESCGDGLEVSASEDRPNWAILEFEKTVLGRHSEVQTEQRL